MATEVMGRMIEWSIEDLSEWDMLVAGKMAGFQQAPVPSQAAVETGELQSNLRIGLWTRA
jgi:hypothetical protein